MYPERERLRREIEINIEENVNNWVKVAFYSDPDVASITDKLYRRWEESGREGSPLDYATLDELRVLAAKSRVYRDVNPSLVLRAFMKGEDVQEESEKGRTSIIKTILRYLFGGLVR